MKKNRLSIFVLFAILSSVWNAFADAKLQVVAPKSVSNVAEDVVFELNGYFTEKLTFRADTPFQLDQVYIVSETNHYYLVQNHASEFSNTHSLDIEGLAVHQVIVKLRAESETSLVDLIAEQINEFPVKTFDFQYPSPHNSYTWDVHHTQPNLRVDTLHIKNQGAKGRIYELHLNYGDGETVYYFSKKENPKQALKNQVVLENSESLNISLDSTRSIHSIKLIGDSYVDGENSQFKLSFEKSQIKEPGPQQSYSFQYSKPHNSYTWDLSAENVQSSFLTATSLAQNGRISQLIVVYFDGTSVDLVQQAKDSDDHIYTHRNGDLSLVLGQAKDSVTFPLDSSRPLKEISMTADSWARNKNSLDIQLELEKNLRLEQTLLIFDSEAESEKVEKVWNIESAEDSEKVKSISIHAVDSNISFQSFQINFANGLTQELTNSQTSGDQSSLNILKEQQTRTFPIISRSRVTSVEVTAAPASRKQKTARIRIVLDKSPLSPVTDFCKDSLGRNHRSNSGKIFEIPVANDLMVNSCKFGGLNNYYYRQYQKQFCENGVITNSKIRVEDKPYKNDEQPCIPTPTSPLALPQACELQVQGQEARLYHTQNFKMENKGLPLSDQLAVVEKSCEFDPGGSNYVYKLFPHRCGSNGTAEILSTTDVSYGRIHSEAVPCPLPRACETNSGPVEHGLQWEENYYNKFQQFIVEEEYCPYDPGVMEFHREKLALNTCYNGSPDESLTEFYPGREVSRCYRNERSNSCSRVESCDPRPQGEPLFAELQLERRRCEAMTFQNFQEVQTRSRRYNVYSATLQSDCDHKTYTIDLYVDKGGESNWGRSGLLDSETPIRRIVCKDDRNQACNGEVRVKNFRPRRCEVSGELLSGSARQLRNGLVVINSFASAKVIVDSEINTCFEKIKVKEFYCDDGQFEQKSDQWEQRDGGSDPNHPSCRSAEETRCVYEKEIVDQRGRSSVESLFLSHNTQKEVVTKRIAAKPCEDGERVFNTFKCWDKLLEPAGETRIEALPATDSDSCRTPEPELKPNPTRQPRPEVKSPAPPPQADDCSHEQPLPMSQETVTIPIANGDNRPVTVRFHPQNPEKCRDIDKKIVETFKCENGVKTLVEGSRQEVSVTREEKRQLCPKRKNGSRGDS